MYEVTEREAYLDSKSWQKFCDSVICPEQPPRTVVAIARKMPRILEYLGVTQNAHCPVLTERALPWLEKSDSESNKIHFCDDVLNVGTTLHHYAKYAIDNGLGSVQLKVYACRRERYEGYNSTPLSNFSLSVSEIFDKKRYLRFETALPQELLTLGKPYDIDFPIISVAISEEEALRSSEDWYDIFSTQFSSVHNLTTLSQKEAGITSISIMEPISLSGDYVFFGRTAGIIPIVKIRLYISAREKIIRIVPIFAPPVSANDLQDRKTFFKNEIDSLFSSLSDKVRAGSPFSLEPIYNLFVYLLSFQYGRMFLPYIRKCISLGDEVIPTLSQVDLEFLFGRQVAQEIREVLGRLLRKDIADSNLSESFPSYPRPKKPMKEKLVQKVLKILEEERYKRAKVHQVFQEAIRIVDKLYHGNDPDLSETFPSYKRLRKGLSLCDLWWLSCKMCSGASPSFEEMSFLLDYYVDLGVVVPVVEEINGIYLRTYRQGEAKPIEFAEFLHGLLAERKSLEPLGVTHFTKILTALAIYFPKQVPFVPTFGLRGGVSNTKNPETIFMDVEDALKFLSRKSIVNILPKKEWLKQKESGGLPLFGE